MKEQTDYEAEYCQNRDRGLQELKAGRIEEALRALGRAVHLRPDLAEAHLNMGHAFQRAGKIEAARRAYERAVEIDPMCADGRSALTALPPPPPGRDDFQVGQVLQSTMTGHHYKVLEVKKGGFGAVYIVWDEKDRTWRALKTFQARYLWSDADRDRFEREAVTWIMLDRHSNIVTAHWVERIEGFPCLVLEYVSGGDLSQLLRQGPLRTGRALELAIQFCDGMGYAHEKLGIVHRDVKPTNCLLTEEGVLKVSDFGLARVFGKGQEKLLGLSGQAWEVQSEYTTLLGTRQYMAPEQFQAGEHLDTRTDIYAFGIMLYQMLTGDLPISGTVAQAHIQESAAAYQVPQGLLELVLRCVEPVVEMRPSSFEEVRKSLGAVYQEMRGSTAPVPMQPFCMERGDWKDKGMALVVLGRYEEALICFGRGLEIDPRNSDLWCNKAAALIELSRYEEAAACCDKGLESAPRDNDLLKNKGIALKSLGRYEEAVDCYDRGLEISPNDGGLWMNKAVALWALGRYEEATASCDRGLKIAPNDSHLWKLKGLALRQLGRVKEAITCYDKGLGIAPRESDLWKAKGVALSSLRQYREAIDCYNRALEVEVSPRDSNLLRSKGWALAQLGRYEEAIACYDCGLKIAPRESDMLANKSEALLLLARYEDVVTCCDQGLKVAPHNTDLLCNKTGALVMLKRYEEAIACCDLGLSIDPRDKDLLKNRAMALIALGRTQEAKECFRRAQELGGK